MHIRYLNTNIKDNPGERIDYYWDVFGEDSKQQYDKLMANENNLPNINPSQQEANGFLYASRNVTQTAWGEIPGQPHGKWVLHFEEGSEALDAAWKKVQQGIADGVFYEAKVSGKSTNPEYKGNQTIMLYTYNHENPLDTKGVYDDIIRRNIHLGAKRPPAYVTDAETIRVHHINKNKQPGEKKEQAQELSVEDFRTPENKVSKYANPPDNAYRLLQLIIKYQLEKLVKPFTNKQCNHFIERLEKADSKAGVVVAKVIFDEIKEMNCFSQAELEQLELASLDNYELLERAEAPFKKIPDEENKVHSFFKLNNFSSAKKMVYLCRQEIEGRLLRTEKMPSISTGIEQELFAKKSDGSSTYPKTVNAVMQNFQQQSSSIDLLLHNRVYSIPIMGEDKASQERRLLVHDIDSQWKKIAYKDKVTDQDKLLAYRDQMFLLAKNNLKPLKKNDGSFWNHAQAALAALGCITIVGLVATGLAMLRSKLDKGTFMFSHAPETLRIKHEAKKSLKKLGHRKSIEQSKDKLKNSYRR